MKFCANERRCECMNRTGETEYAMNTRTIRHVAGRCRIPTVVERGAVMADLEVRRACVGDGKASGRNRRYYALQCENKD
jgi:hypothetical protein